MKTLFSVKEGRLSLTLIFALLLLLVLLFLTSCQTTGDQDVDISDVNVYSTQTVGYYVMYSEICAQFQGNGADNMKLRALKEKHKNSTGFERGYYVNRSLLGMDGVTNLTKCMKAKAIVNAAYDNIN